MSSYLVVGAGAIGSATSQLLAEEGHHVRLASRRGTGPQHPNITSVALDAAEADGLIQQAVGVDAIFNCVNPAYHRWLTDWPPIADSLLRASERSGAVLVTLSNLYPYGLTSGPMSPRSPFLARYAKAKVREEMWLDALEAHEAGRIRATEVRASDFIGPLAEGHMGQRTVPRVLAGKGCQVLGSPDTLHSWTFTLDVAQTLVTCAQREEAWGQAWHVPTNAARTQRQVIDDIADVAGVAHVKVTRIPDIGLRLAGLFSPTIRELPKTLYQFTNDFIIDDSATRETFNLAPTPWNEVLSTTVQSFKN